MGRCILIFKFNHIKQGVLTLLALMVLTSCTTTITGDSAPKLSEITPDSRETVLSQANTAEQKSQFDKAIVLYVKALELKPETEEMPIPSMSNTDIFYQIGLLEIKQTNIELARKAFSQVLKDDPNHSLAQTQLGLIYLSQKNKQDALSLLTKAISADQQRLSNQGKQVQSYYQLDELSPLQAYMGLAVINDLKSQQNEAMILFELILTITPQDPIILTNMGYSHYLTGNFVEAELYFKKAINIDMQYSRAWANLGLVYVRKGMYTRALQALKQIMPTAHAYNDIGYFLMLEGRYSEAEYFLQHAIDLSPTYFVKANTNLENVKLELKKHKNMASLGN